MQTISGDLAAAIRDDTQYANAKVIARFADSRYMDNLVVTSNDTSFGEFPLGIEYFKPYQGANTIEEQTFAWGVTDTYDERGNYATANGEYYVMPNEYSEDEEFGWWSKGRSDANGDFGTDPFVRYQFDQRKATSIEVVTAYRHGRIDRYLVDYYDSSNVLTNLGVFNMPVGQTRQSHDLGGVTEIRGVKITVESTQNPFDLARIYEVVPAYDVDVSENVVSFDLNQEREHYDDGSSPIGHIAAGSGSVTFENTEKLFNVDGVSDYANYIRVDTRLDTYVGWDTGGHLYVPGINGNYASSPTPGAVANISGDLEFIAEVSPPEGQSFYQSQPTGGNFFSTHAHNFRGYRFKINYSGTLTTALWTGSAGSEYVNSAADPAFYNRTERTFLKFVRPANSADRLFYWSEDGDTWNQIGSVVSSGQTGTIVPNTMDNMVLGAGWSSGSGEIYKGTIHSVRVSDGGETVLYTDFRQAEPGTTSFTDGGGNVWTINQSGGGAVAEITGGFEYVPVGKFYVDNWSVDESMIVNAGVRDRSKFMQETVLDEGYLRADITAGEGIADLAKMAGVADEKIRIHKPYNDYVIERGAKFYWPMNDQGTSGLFGGSFDGEVVEELQEGNNGAIVGTGVSQGNPGLINGSNDYSTNFGQINGSYINLGNDTGLDFDGSQSFSFELMVRFNSFPTSNRNYLFTKGAGGNLNVYNYWAAIGSSGKITMAVGDGTSEIQLVHDTVLSVGEVYHIITEYNADTDRLGVTINGDDTKIGGVTGVSIYTNSDPVTLGAINPTYTGYVDELDGDMSHFAVYDFVLSAEEKLKAYQYTQVTEIPTYPYFYGSDQTVWETMLEWATADLGTFYFDENEYFNYDFNNSLYEPVLTRHSVSQYSVSDDEEIISGGYQVDLQTNKVIVKQNPITSINTGFQQIWRAESGASLAVTQSVAALGATDTELAVESTGLPPWPETGYLKVDDEIMSYNGKTGYKFLNLTRGELNNTALYTPGTAGNYASTPTFSELDAITDDIDIIWYGTVEAYGGQQTLVAHRSSGVANGHFQLRLNESNPSAVLWMGGSFYGPGGNALTGVPASTLRGVRLTSVKSTRAYQFYIDRGNGWEAWGNGTAGPAGTAFDTSTKPLTIGATGDGTERLKGTTKQVYVKDGVDGTIVASADFTDQEIGATAFTDGQGNTWTVNQSGSPAAEIKKSGVPHASGSLVREARRYEIEYSQTPAIAVKRPLITAQWYDGTVDIDFWIADSYKATAWVSANTSNTKGEIAILEGPNPETGQNNYFAISGVPLVEQTGGQEIIDKVESLNDNIRKYGKKELVIDNKFIQTEKRATDLAAFMISNYGTPVSIINLDTTCIPHVELGDRITVTSFDQLDINNKEYWIVGKVTRFDGGVQNSFILREAQ